jgi:putative ABC transport system permease protein
MTVSAAVATALLTLYVDLDAKLHHEFRSFGANIVVTEAAPETDLVLKTRQATGSEATVAAFGYAVATTDRGTPVVVSGVDFVDVRRLDSWWQVGGWPSGSDAALLGSRAAEFMGNEKDVTLTFAGKAKTFHGVGRLKTGGDEDSRIYVPMAAFEAWTGVKANVVEVQVPGGAASVEAAIVRLKTALPQAQVTPVRQLIDGESRIVDRTRALMFGAVLLIGLTVGVSVLATLSASVLERRRDFALMKALGGREWQMTGLFLLETLVLAGAGVVGGYILGSALAWEIGEANFHTATMPRVGVLPFVVVLNITIALLAAVLPMRALRNLEPAALLKGE